jgi:hypothetical protein
VSVSYVDVNSTKIELWNAHDTGQDVDSRLSRRAWINQVDIARIQLHLLLTKTHFRTMCLVGWSTSIIIWEFCYYFVSALSLYFYISLKNCWDNMLTETHTLADGSLKQQTLGIRLINAVMISLVSQYNIYLVKITLFTIGEALDPRLFGTLTSAGKKLLCLTRWEICLLILSTIQYTSPNGRYISTTVPLLLLQQEGHLEISSPQ